MSHPDWDEESEWIRGEPCERMGCDDKGEALHLGCFVILCDVHRWDHLCSPFEVLLARIAIKVHRSLK